MQQQVDHKNQREFNGIPDYNRGFKRQNGRTQDELLNIHTTFQVKLTNRDWER